MSTIENELDAIEYKIIHFFHNNEPIITEYVLIPFLFESVFNFEKYKLMRCFLASLLILKQIIVCTNSKYIKFNNIQLLTPFLGYIVLNNRITSSLTYGFAYGSNIYEGMFLALFSNIFNTINNNFAMVYIFHILYILGRNNLDIILEEDDSTQKSIYIKPMSKIIPSFHNRFIKIKSDVVTFINDRVEYILDN